MSAAPITCVSDYIQQIHEILAEHPGDGTHFLYRGECRSYRTNCRPNIFRNRILSTNPYYEKSLFNTMRQNRLSNSNSYLENAIDAQHGEFPSRLLDVSYNCLTALYFATTPYYHKGEAEYDGPSKEKDVENDGTVFIFYIDEIFSPSAENTNDNYNAIINKNLPWFTDSSIFQKNHKFIDHTKLNHRIIAQQGAFILFQGDDGEKLPEYMVREIKIPYTSKKRIRQELSQMFGINTASIYPEIVNAARDLTHKSKSLVTEKFCWENEMKYVLSNLQKEIAYYQEKLPCQDASDPVAYYSRVHAFEVLINSYRVGIIEFFRDMESRSDGTSASIASDIHWNTKKQKFLSQYNEIIQDLQSYFLTEHHTELSDLRIEEK